jgi:hypothetical protein
MTRRDFIAGLGGAAVWPIAAHAQQGDHPHNLSIEILSLKAGPKQRAAPMSDLGSREEMPLGALRALGPLEPTSDPLRPSNSNILVGSVLGGGFGGEWP